MIISNFGKKKVSQPATPLFSFSFPTLMPPPHREVMKGWFQKAEEEGKEAGTRSPQVLFCSDVNAYVRKYHYEWPFVCMFVLMLQVCRVCASLFA